MTKMRKGFGYTTTVVEQNKSADARTSVGVRLGRECIKHGIPAMDVAEDLGVTVMTVYNWFCGRNAPADKHKDVIVSYIEHLKVKHKQAA